MTDRVISWNTRKVAKGYQFQVYALGHQVPTEILKLGVCPTRAIAADRARKWTKFFKTDARVHGEIRWLKTMPSSEMLPQ